MAAGVRLHEADGTVSPIGVTLAHVLLWKVDVESSSDVCDLAKLNKQFCQEACQEVSRVSYRRTRAELLILTVYPPFPDWHRTSMRRRIDYLCGQFSMVHFFWQLGASLRIGGIVTLYIAWVKSDVHPDVFPVSSMPLYGRLASKQ